MTVKRHSCVIETSSKRHTTVINFETPKLIRCKSFICKQPLHYSVRQASLILISSPLFRRMKMRVSASTLLAATGVFSLMYTRQASLAMTDCGRSVRCFEPGGLIKNPRCLERLLADRAVFSADSHVKNRNVRTSQISLTHTSVD